MNNDEPIEYTGPVPDYIRNHIERAEVIIADGGAVWWKWTCQGCRARQTFDDANALHLTGACEECGHVTNLLEGGAKVDVGFDAAIVVKP